MQPDSPRPRRLPGEPSRRSPQHPNRDAGRRQPATSWQQPEVIRRVNAVGGIEVRIERIKPHGGGESLYRVIGEWTEDRGTPEECHTRSETYIHVPPNVAGTIRESGVIANACRDELLKMLAKAKQATR